MREAEEEDRIEQEKKKMQSSNISTTFGSQNVEGLSDEELLAEMNRRTEVR